MQQKTEQVEQVAVSSEGVQAATGKTRVPISEDKVREALVTRGPSMFMAPAEKRHE